MKWLKFALTILEYLLPFIAKKGKDNLAHELEIANKTISLMSGNISPEEKGRYIEQAVSSLKCVQDFKKRVSKKIDKAKDRLYKKVF
ncbi:unnamed protein product [marine sediment metagenome]|uniref:Uncharacterized protein n=1 Tax=marine sediment metagenome TaxID=412755 RepID=X1G8F1_9ZZZZ